MIILVSPSGGGKSTMTRRLMQDLDWLRFSVSATTRKPRQGEEHGKDYFFLSEEEFRRKIADKEFLEWEEFYNGTLYGTLRSVVENDLKKGYFVLLDIDVLGALNVKNSFGDQALAIFLSPPSLEVLKRRLELRGTETPESLQTRIDRASTEMSYADRFDAIVVNDDLETAYSEILELVQNHH